MEFGKEGETTDLEGLGWGGFDRAGWVKKKKTPLLNFAR
jgi:hypothetical protein